MVRDISFLDIETTGINPQMDRIIEIGIVRVQNDKIVGKFDSLINSQTGIPPFIKNLTGIDDKDIENAPSFYEVGDEISQILSDSILVAHNARFDYGFLKSEFKRLGKTFSTKHFCSIKLARQLFPNLTYYNLDSIIRNFGIECKRRHRAFDDAKVIFDFFNIAKKQVSEKTFGNAIDIALKKPSMPLNLSEDLLDGLPESPGAYIFYGEDNYPIYIGKSVNIRERVLSHFANSHTLVKDFQIAQRVTHIEAIKTAGELGALLLESTLIKKFQPIYNRMLRYSRKMIILFNSKDKNEFSTVKVKETEKIDLKDTENLIGVYKSKKQLNNHLYQLAKEHNLCPKLMGLDHSKNFCFYYHLNICKGACGNKEKNIKYNLRFDMAFYKYKIKRWIFDSPIIIKEKGDLEEVFVVDKWCLIGSIKNEDDIYNLDKEYRFDLDTYKILYKHILKPTRNLSIRPFILDSL